MRAIGIMAAFLLAGLLLAPAQAAQKDQRWAPVELELSLGVSEPHSDYLFHPDKFELKLGTLYKMTIRNPSRITHYFSAGDLTYGAFTRKLVVVLADGTRIVKHRRTIAKLMLPPGSVAEWTFLASRRGKDLKIFCFLPEHRKKGMMGTVVVR